MTSWIDLYAGFEKSAPTSWSQESARDIRTRDSKAICPVCSKRRSAPRETPDCSESCFWVTPIARLLAFSRVATALEVSVGDSMVLSLFKLLIYAQSTQKLESIAHILAPTLLRNPSHIRTTEPGSIVRIRRRRLAFAETHRRRGCVGDISSRRGTSRFPLVGPAE